MSRYGWTDPRTYGVSVQARLERLRTYWAIASKARQTPGRQAQLDRYASEAAYLKELRQDGEK